MGTILEKYELHVMTKVVQNIFLARKISKSLKKPGKCQIFLTMTKALTNANGYICKAIIQSTFQFWSLVKKKFFFKFYDMSFFVFVQITTVTLKDERDWYRDQT